MFSNQKRSVFTTNILWGGGQNFVDKLLRIPRALKLINFKKRSNLLIHIFVSVFTEESIFRKHQLIKDIFLDLIRISC